MKIKIKTVIAPTGCGEYLTEGKEYKAFDNTRDGFWIEDDLGLMAYCKAEGCAHLNGGNWIIKE